MKTKNCNLSNVRLAQSGERLPYKQKVTGSKPVADTTYCENYMSTSNHWLDVKRNLPYHFIYEVKCSVTGEFYRGKHSTDDLSDGYLGSGRWIKDGIRKYGKSRFTRTIIQMCSFDCLDDVEKVLIELVYNNRLCRNKRKGGEGGRTRPGTVVVKYPGTRKCFSVSVDDPRYLAGELVHGTTGLRTVRDVKTGRCISISKDDPSFNTKRYVHNTAGLANYRDRDGVLYCLPIDDPRVKSGELVGASKGRVRVMKSGKIKYINPGELTEYLDDGWCRNVK